MLIGEAVDFSRFHFRTTFKSIFGPEKQACMREVAELVQSLKRLPPAPSGAGTSLR